MNTKPTGWNSPLCLCLIATTLGLFGNIAATMIQTRTNERLAYERIQSDLILQAVKDPQHAPDNLRFLITHRILDDNERVLSEHLYSPGNPGDKVPSYFWVARHPEDNF